MNIVVTGATSFIGAPLVKELLKNGHQVFAVVRPNTVNLGRLYQEAAELRIVEMDLGELERIGERVPVSCDFFYHFGWNGAGSENRTNREVQQRNVEDSLCALRGAKSLGCRKFLFSGSQAEYGICQDAMREDTLCHPISEYGKAKVDFYDRAMEALEQWRREEGVDMKYIHTRIFSIYGPGDHPWSLVESCLKSFTKGEYLSLGECTQRWNYLYIDDLIRALKMLMEQENVASGVYNVAGQEKETRVLREYVRMIYEACGCHGSYSYGRRAQNAEGPANLIPDIKKLEQTIRWQQEMSFKEGIKTLLQTGKYR